MDIKSKFSPLVWTLQGEKSQAPRGFSKVNSTLPENRISRDGYQPKTVRWGRRGMAAADTLESRWQWDLTEDRNNLGRAKPRNSGPTRDQYRKDELKSLARDGTKLDVRKGCAGIEVKRP